MTGLERTDDVNFLLTAVLALDQEYLKQHYEAAEKQRRKAAAKAANKRAAP